LQEFIIQSYILHTHANNVKNYACDLMKRDDPVIIRIWQPWVWCDLWDYARNYYGQNLASLLCRFRRAAVLVIFRFAVQRRILVFSRSPVCGNRKTPCCIELLNALQQETMKYSLAMFSVQYAPTLW